MSTLSIPGAMKSVDRTRDDEGALVGVQAEFPQFGDKRKAYSLAAAGNKRSISALKYFNRVHYLPCCPNQLNLFSLCTLL